MLMIQTALGQFDLMELILLGNISVMPKMVKKVIAALDSAKEISESRDGKMINFV